MSLHQLVILPSSPGTNFHVTITIKPCFGVITLYFQAVLPPVVNAVQALEKCGLHFDVFDNVRVEPTDSSFKECIEFARNLNPDAFLGE